MIIDIHTHIWGTGFIPLAFHRRTAELWASLEEGRTPEMILPRIEEGLIDPDGSMFIDNMNRAGVDVSVTMTCDYRVFWCGEEPETALEEQLYHYSQLQKKHQGRIYAFAFIDPRRKNSVELFEKAI